MKRERSDRHSSAMQATEFFSGITLRTHEGFFPFSSYVHNIPDSSCAGHENHTLKGFGSHIRIYYYIYFIGLIR